MTIFISEPPTALYEQLLGVLGVYESSVIPINEISQHTIPQWVPKDTQYCIEVSVTIDVTDELLLQLHTITHQSSISLQIQYLPDTYERKHIYIYPTVNTFSALEQFYDSYRS